jgi:hypothetical protein
MSTLNEKMDSWFGANRFYISYITKKKKEKNTTWLLEFYGKINQTHLDFNPFEFIELYIRPERERVQRTGKYNTQVL